MKTLVRMKSNMRRITLGYWRSIDPKANRYRYYRIELSEDLWGDLCLIKTWGRIGRSAYHKMHWLDSSKDLASVLQETVLLRVHHGYKLN